MLLKEITFEDFRQYKGIQKIEFSGDAEKNVTVITGKNTGGKTTFVQGFIWCLYGKISFSDKKLINAEEEQKLLDRPEGAGVNVSVKLVITQKKITYKIKRSLVYENKGKSISVVNNDFTVLVGTDEDGYREGADPNTIIQQVLPQELSDYFFFWGEKIENLDTKKNISSAVKNFLGLAAIDNARDHLRSVICDYTKILGGLNENDDRVLKLNRLLKKIENDIPKKEEELENEENNLQFYKQKYDEYDNQLLTNKKSAEFAKKAKDLENMIENKKLSSNQNFESLLRGFNSNPHIYFSKRLEKELLEVLKQLPHEEEGLLHQTPKSINELINRKICVCGRPLIEDSDAYEHILEELKKIPPASIFSKVEDYKKEIILRNKQIELYIDNFKNNYKNYAGDNEDIEEAENELKIVKKNIDKDIDIAGIQKSRNSFYSKCLESSRKVQKLKDELKKLEENKDTYIYNINIFSSRSEKSKKLKTYISYADAVINSINLDYSDKEEAIVIRLNKLVNQYFKRMYHGERNISIDKNFKLKLSSNVGGKKIVTEESPGLQTVKNFAFIASLVEIAKEKSNEKNVDNTDFEIEPYPLVLDAPFSQADEVHVPNICKLISSVAEQTIIVVMEKDWNYAKEIMKEKVGKAYKLEKKSETYTKIISTEWRN